MIPELIEIKEFIDWLIDHFVDALSENIKLRKKLEIVEEALLKIAPMPDKVFVNGVETDSATVMRELAQDVLKNIKG